MATTGTTTVTFGAAPGSTHASVAVTGQAAILSGSLVEAWLFPGTTADHSSDEHVMAASMVDVIASDVVAATGFTIHIVARQFQSGSALEVPQRPDSATPAGLSDRNVGNSVGGTELNLHYGVYNVAWVWN